jgi:hypothetical protein
MPRANPTPPDHLAESLRRAAARPDADPRLRAWLDKLLADAAEDVELTRCEKTEAARV